MVYFVNSKADIYKAFELYLRDMKSLGVTVRNIQTDRGSEYFSQEGDIIEDRDCNLHKFGKVCLCSRSHIRHLVQPVELKEKVAENSFRYLFRAVNSMLWEARLSPAFWVMLVPMLSIFGIELLIIVLVIALLLGQYLQVNELAGTSSKFR